LSGAAKMPRRVVVLGGGISGLAAAYTITRAREAGAPIVESLIEAGDRLGGVIRTERCEGFLIEAGPDSFLTEKPEAAALCRELGLGDLLIGSKEEYRRTYILHRGRLVELPEGLQLFAPTRLWPVLASPLIPPRSKLAALIEWFKSPPSKAAAEDESVADFVRRHFGDGVLENVADPLLAGVYGGDSGRLSAQAVLPRLWELEQKHGSLIRALRKSRALARQAKQDSKDNQAEASKTLAPLFTALNDGLGRMVDGLKSRLARARIFFRERALEIECCPAGAQGRANPDTHAYKVRNERGAVHEADAIVLALPAYESARLVSRLDADLAESLKAIPYTSALTVALAYEAVACEHLPLGSGFLVPKKEDRRLLACTFVHRKFPHRVPPAKALLRCFLGGSRDPGALELGDDEIVSILQRELKDILKLSAEPLFCRISRWPHSMPQYVVGHGERLEKIRAQLGSHPGLFLAGNAYSGIGMSDCIRSGRAAAERALSYVLG